MGLFSRRRIQEALDNLHPILQAKTLSQLIVRLESGGSVTLSAEWEAAVFDAFQRCVPIEVERALGGDARIDMLVQDEQIDSAGLAVEVTTITNESIEALNPIDEFWSKLGAAFEKFGIAPGGIHLDIEMRFHIERKEAIVLALPPVHEMDEAIKKHIFPMLREIAASKRPAFRRINDDGMKLVVSWQPGKSLNSGNWGGYEGNIYALRNALLNRLNEKRKQIKRSGHKGRAGIMVCDGGAAFFENLEQRTSSYKLREDVIDFLRQTNSVHFVSFLSVAKAPPYLARNSRSARSIFIETIFAKDVPEHVQSKINTLFERVADRLPQPLTDPKHALRIIKYFGGNRAWRFEHSYPGGKSIKVPASAVLQFLGGKMTFDEFARAAGFFWHKPGEPKGNVLLGGDVSFAISDVRLRRTESDDDYIVFEFVEDDPANTKFR